MEEEIRMIPHACHAIEKPYQLIRQRDVDKLVQSSGTKDGWINDVRPVGGSNDEHILLIAHSVHLSEHLIDHTVSSPS